MQRVVYSRISREREGESGRIISSKLFSFQKLRIISFAQASIRISPWWYTLTLVPFEELQNVIDHGHVTLASPCSPLRFVIMLFFCTRMKRIYRPRCLPSPQPRIISLVREVSFHHARNRESIPMRAINRKKSTRDSLSAFVPRVLLLLRYLPPLIFAHLAKSTEVVIISERFGVAKITIFTSRFFSVSRCFFFL